MQEEEKARIVICFHPEDADLKDKLMEHLDALRRFDRVAVWDASQIHVGEEWQLQVDKALAQADLALLLVSSSFLASDILHDIELPRLLRRHAESGAKIVPVLLRSCSWSIHPIIRNYPIIPRTCEAIASFKDDKRDQVFAEVAREIAKILNISYIRKLKRSLNCPFPGLEFFDSRHADIFCARDLEIKESIALLGQTETGHRRWLQIEGPSGSGKSSLVRAGITHQLTHKLISIRGAFADWITITLKPGTQPIDSLAYAFLSAIRSIDDININQYVEHWNNNNNALRDYVRTHSSGKYGILLIIDQLEELFTLSEYHKSSETVSVFCENILNAINDTDGPIYLLTAIRSDFVGHFEKTPLEQYINKAGRYYLRPMDNKKLEAALIELSRRLEFTWEPELISRFLNDASKHNGSLPLVGNMLRILWETCIDEDYRTLKLIAYERAGGLGGALSQSADELLNQLGNDGRCRAQNLLLSLIKYSRGEPPTKRMITRTEAVNAAGGEPDGERILARLSGGRNPDAPPTATPTPRLISISSSEYEPGIYRIDLVHDTLLKEWGTLSTWIDTNRKMLERRDDLETAALAWEAADQPADGLPGSAMLAYYSGIGLPLTDTPRYITLQSERAKAYLAKAHTSAKQKRRMRRIGIIAALLVATVAVSMAMLAGWQSRRAHIQEQLALSRLHDSTDAVDHIIFILHTKLGTVAGASDTQFELLNESFKLLGRLLSSESIEVMYRLCVTHEREGTLQLIHDGDTKKARENFEKSTAIAIELTKKEPSNIEYKRRLSIAYSRLGDIANAEGKWSIARSWFQKDLEIALSLAKDMPETIRYKRDLANSYDKLGDSATHEKNYELASDMYINSNELAIQVISAEPTITENLRDHWVSCEKLANLNIARKRFEEARKYNQEAISIAKEMHHREPSNADYNRSRHISYSTLANILLLQGKSKQAIHAINKGFSIIQELNRSDPKNTDYQLDTSIIMSLYGRFEEKEKNYSAAYAWHMQELKIVLEIYAGNENNAEILSNLAETYLNLYKTASNLEKRLEAEQWCRKYLETQKKFLQLDNNNKAYRSNLAHARNILSEELSKQKKLIEAISVVQNNLNDMKDFANNSENNEDGFIVLAESLKLMSNYHIKLKKFDQARKYAEECIRILIGLKKTTINYFIVLTEAHIFLAIIEKQQSEIKKFREHILVAKKILASIDKDIVTENEDMIDKIIHEIQYLAHDM